MADYFVCSAGDDEWEIDGRMHTQVIGEFVRALEEDSGLVCCAGPRLESESGRTFNYELTLGEPIASGGFSPVRTVRASLTGHDRERG